MNEHSTKLCNLLIWLLDDVITVKYRMSWKFTSLQHRALLCLDSISNLQLGLVCKRVHTVDRTGQNCLVSNILRTTVNNLDLSPILFTPPISQSCLSVLVVWTKHYSYMPVCGSVRSSNLVTAVSPLLGPSYRTTFGNMTLWCGFMCNKIK